MTSRDTTHIEKMNADIGDDAAGFLQLTLPTAVVPVAAGGDVSDSGEEMRLPLENLTGEEQRVTPSRHIITRDTAPEQFLKRLMAEWRLKGEETRMA
jgi:hypothetical protein